MAVSGAVCGRRPRHGFARGGIHTLHGRPIVRRWAIIHHGVQQRLHTDVAVGRTAQDRRETPRDQTLADQALEPRRIQRIFILQPSRTWPRRRFRRVARSACDAKRQPPRAFHPARCRQTAACCWPSHISDRMVTRSTTPRNRPSAPSGSCSTSGVAPRRSSDLRAPCRRSPRRAGPSC